MKKLNKKCLNGIFFLYPEKLVLDILKFCVVNGVKIRPPLTTVLWFHEVDSKWANHKILQLFTWTWINAILTLRMLMDFSYRFDTINMG